MTLQGISMMRSVVFDCSKSDGKKMKRIKCKVQNAKRLCCPVCIGSTDRDPHFSFFIFHFSFFISLSLLCLALADPVFAQDRQGYALQAEGKLVFIDVGSDDNVQAGAFFQVIRQETIIHPATGENLSEPVPLGVVQVVEVFPRFSTATLVDLDRGVDVETLDKEAKQGLIRIQALSEEKVAAMGLKLKPSPAMEAAPDDAASNPDGPIRGLVPDFQFSFGSGAITSFPDSVFMLIPEDLRDLRSRADADSVNRKLEGVDGAKDVRISLKAPLSPRVSALAELQIGNRSIFAAGARLYPGALFGSGASTNPDGRVGEPVLSVMVGRGGAGSQTLPQQALDQIVARSDSAFVVDELGLVFPTPVGEEQTLADSLTAIGDTLRAAASVVADSLGALSKRGVGFSLQVALPLSQRLTGRLGIRRFGNISEFSGGMTFYMRAVAPGNAANPDGRVGSPVLALGVIYNTKSERTSVHLDLTYPLARRYSLGLSYLTDLGGYSRVGLRFKSYLSLF